MKKKTIRFVQAQLNARGLDAGLEDGLLGPRTLGALDRVEGIPADWAKTRKAVAFIQLLAKEHAIETGKVDGYWGPQTDFAFGELLQILVEGKDTEIWRPEDLPDVNPNGWPSQSPQENLFRFYGRVGENQTSVELPYPHKLSWNKATVLHRFQCHERVSGSLLRVLSRVLDHYQVFMVLVLPLIYINDATRGQSGLQEDNACQKKRILGNTQVLFSGFLSFSISF